MMKAKRKIWFAMVVCLCFGLMLSFKSAFGQAEKSEKIQPEKKIAGTQIIRLHSSGGIILPRQQ